MIKYDNNDDFSHVPQVLQLPVCLLMYQSYCRLGVEKLKDNTERKSVFCTSYVYGYRYLMPSSLMLPFISALSCVLLLCAP